MRVEEANQNEEQEGVGETGKDEMDSRKDEKGIYVCHDVRAFTPLQLQFFYGIISKNTPPILGFASPNIVSTLLYDQLFGSGKVYNFIPLSLQTWHDNNNTLPLVIAIKSDL